MGRNANADAEALKSGIAEMPVGQALPENFWTRQIDRGVRYQRALWANTALPIILERSWSHLWNAHSYDRERCLSQRKKRKYETIIV